MIYLNIPNLPEHIFQQALLISEEVPDDLIGMNGVQSWYGNSIRVGSHVYGRVNAILPNDMQLELNEIYSSYFNCNFTAIIGKLKNVYGNGTVCIPPHCDRRRLIAINYLMKSGGCNVETVIYKTGRTNLDLSKAQDARYEDLEINFKTCIPIKTWHAYNVQYYHSVENIENTRLLFSLVLDTDIQGILTYNTFLDRYKHLII